MIAIAASTVLAAGSKPCGSPIRSTRETAALGTTAQPMPGSAQQTEILKAIEDTPAFGMFQFSTVVGFLCNPEDGGNRDTVGWKLIGFDHAPAHSPPFGYYDAEYLAEQAAARKGAKP